MLSFNKVFAAVSLAMLSIVQGQTIPADCTRTYTVVSGDYCDAISAAQNSSTFQLANASPWVDAACDDLFVGEVLCLGLTGEDCNVTSVVPDGGSCSVMAETAGISLATIIANNPNVNTDCTNIYPGEVLCTSGGSFVYA